MLGGFEALGLLASSRDSDEALDLREVFGALEAALVAVKNARGSRPPAARSEATSDAAPPAAKAQAPPPEERTVAEHTQRHERSLPIESVQPLLYELRRLHAEQALLLPELAEVQRQVRALLAEIRPDVSAELLRERIVKTLGYGTEIERRLSALRESWSANEFTTSLTIEQLEDLGHRASLVSVDELVAHVHRIARSAARTLGKEVTVEVTGDALLDAAVEKRLRPCLLHLVRNAVDHGIESAESRAARHKPPRGRIHVALVQDETTVRAMVEDDGGGIDFDGLRRKLEQNENAPRGMSDAQVLDRIFEHGVSVREVATQISGRGVGLDVVAREIAAIGGSVAVESTEGVGARFLLTVPTKLEADVVVPLLSLGQTYAVSARSVVTVRRVQAMEETARGPMMRVGDDEGALVPVHALSAIVQGRGRSRIGDVAVVLRHRAGDVALTLDAVQNPRPITFQRTEELAFRSPIVRGVGVLPDGGTIQLLDVEAIHGVTSRSDVMPVDAASGEAHALVVEDAPVARELLVGLLRSFGLRVTEAVDGRDGLARALSDRPDSGADRPRDAVPRRARPHLEAPPRALDRRSPDRRLDHPL